MIDKMTTKKPNINQKNKLLKWVVLSEPSLKITMLQSHVSKFTNMINHIIFLPCLFGMFGG